MRILSNVNILGTLDLDNVQNAAADTDRFLVQDANGVVKFRTGAEVASDIGASVGFVSTVKHEVKLGEAIATGQAVYVTSADGTNMIVSKASNGSDATSSKTLGLIQTGGITNDIRYVITEGLLAGLDTSTAVAGDPVWLGTNGNLLFGLANKPVAPAHMVFIGVVTRVQQNNGEIFVKVQNGFELEELHNVLITGTPVDKAVIQYDTASGLWKNSALGGVTGTGVSGQVAFWNSANTQTGSNNLFWDATNNRLGIGVSTPLASLQIGNGYTDSLYDGFKTTNSPEFLIVSSNANSYHRILGGLYNNASTINLDLALPLTKNLGTNGTGFRITSGVGSGVGTTNGYLAFSSLTGESSETFTATERMRIFASTGNLHLGGTSDNGLRFQVTGDGFFSGAVGIGTSSISGFSLLINHAITTGAAVAASSVRSTIQSQVTTEWNSYQSLVGTQAATFTLSNLRHFAAQQSTFGAGSTVTNQFGFKVDGNLIGATNNFAFHSDLNSGTGRWNLYMNGSAANYANGNTLIGEPRLAGAAWTKYLVVGDPSLDKVILGYLASSTNGATIGANNGNLNAWANLNITGSQLIFRSNGETERMRLDASGNLGLGVTPTYPLHLVRNSNSATAVYISNTTAGNISEISYVVNSDASAGVAAFTKYSSARTTYRVLSGSDASIYNGTAGDIVLFNDHANGKIRFAGGGVSTSQMTLFATGNLGIGVTSDATYRLDVNGTMRVSGASTFTASGASVKLVTTTDSAIWTEIANSGRTFYLGLDNTAGSSFGVSGGSVLYSDGSRPMVFFTNSTERFRIASTGAATFSSSVSAGHFIATTPLAAHLTSAGALQYNANGVSIRAYGATAGTGFFTIRTGGGGGSADVERVVVAANGNVGFNSTTLFVDAVNDRVGIGLTSPGAKLDVVGVTGTALIRATAVDTNGNAEVEIKSTGTTGVSRIYFSDTAALSGSITYNHSADSMTFGTSAATRMTLNSNGNLGLGVTPSSWNTSFVVHQLGGTAYIFGRTAGINQAEIGQNAYFQAGVGWTYLANAFANRYILDGTSGSHVWFTAPSGTAGNGITFTQAMTLDVSGNLAIGTTTTTNRLEVWGTGNTAARVAALSAGTSSLILSSGGVTAYTIKSGNGDSSLRIDQDGTDRIILASGGALRFTAYGTGARTGTVAYNLAVDASGNVIETAGGVVDGSGTANYISKWQDANTLTNSLLFDNGTGVGIGTTTPTSRLQVTTTAWNSTEPFVSFVNLDPQGVESKGLYVQAGANTSGSYIANFSNYSGTSVFYLDGLGNLGLKTTSPTHTLDVADSARFRNQIRFATDLWNVSHTDSANRLFFSASGSTFFGTASGYNWQNSGGSNIMSLFGTGNLHLGGTSDNGLRFQVTGDGYFSGSVGIGATSGLSSINFRISKDISGGATAYGQITDGQIQTGVTANGVYSQTSASTVASTTLTNIYYSRLIQGTFGAGSTITNQFGYFVDASLTGATNNYGFYGNIASGTGRWNLYMNGTAANYLAGDTYIGINTLRTSDASIRKLIINGSQDGIGAEIVLCNETANDGASNAISFTGIRGAYGISGQIRTTRRGIMTFHTQDLQSLVSPPERMRLDAIGNLGLGVVPSAWGGTIKSLELPGGISFFALGSAPGDAYITQNATFNGANWIYKTTAASGVYRLLSGSHAWFNAPSGTAGGTVTFTQAMTLHSTGNLAIGTTTDGTQRLQVAGNVKFDSDGATNGFYWDNTNKRLGIGVNAPSWSLDIATAGIAISRIRGGGSANQGAAYFVTQGGTNTTLLAIGDGSTMIGGAINNAMIYVNGSPLSFNMSGSTRLTLLQNGNLGIGQSTPLSLLHIANTSGAPIYLEDTDATSTFNITSISNNGGNFNIETRSSAGVFVSSDYQIVKETVSSSYHRWFTSSSERMRITANGDVGIGTTSPSSLLHISGGASSLQITDTAKTLVNTLSIYALSQTSWAIATGTSGTLGTQRITLRDDGYIRFNSYGTGTITGTAAYNLAVDASGNIIETAGGVIDGSGTANYIPKWQDANTLTNSLIYDDGTTIGIGTTAVNSNEKLRIDGGRLNVLGGSEGYQLKLAYNNATAGFWLGSPSANALAFYNDGGTERMRITSTGSVGIGTTTPTQKLTILDGSLGFSNTAAGGEFATIGVGASTSQLAFSVNGANGFTYSTVSDNTKGQLSVRNSHTNSFPSYSFLTDTNTGIANANGTADTLNFITGGIERARIDASGNLGLGVTPSAWGSNYKVFEGSFFSIANEGVSYGQAILGNNAYNDGTSASPTWKRKQPGSASMYIQDAAQVPMHSWFTAGSGAAGSAITFTRSMTLTSSGNLLLGSTGDTNERLQVTGSVRLTGASALLGNVTFGTLAVGTGMYWDNTNNRLGIGMSLPATQLHVRNATGAIITIESTNAGFVATPVETSINFNGYGANLQAQISSQDRQANIVGGKLYFRLKDTANVLQDRLVIDRDGSSTFLGSITAASLNVSGASTFGGVLNANLSGGNIRVAGTTDGGIWTAGSILRIADWATGTKKLDIDLTTGAATFSSTVTATRGLFGTTTFNSAAILQADSTTQGFLPPRMTAAQRAAIASVPVGLVVYQTDGTEGLYIYTNANGWKSLAIVN